MEVRLRVTHCTGLIRPREVPLTLSESGIDIGRALTSDLCLEDSARLVSGLHARIQAREGRICLTDLSRNGTYLNGAPDPIPTRQPVQLHDGDRIGIGSYEVLVLLGTSSVASPVRPRQRPVQPAVEESPTAVWALPELPVTDRVSATHMTDDPFAATTRFDVTQAGVTPLEAGSATTLVQVPPADETQPCIPSLPRLDDGATEAMPALIRSDAPTMDAEIQAARRALLARFEPLALERRFIGVPSSGQGLSIEDKARCWDGFKTIYARLVAGERPDALSDIERDAQQCLR